jgi:hypothetical protein
MKFLVNTPKVLLLVAATLPIAFQLHAQEFSPLVGPRPPKAGDERIVRSTVEGYLRVYTPEIPVYDDDGQIGWDNDNYRIVPESGGRARNWFDRRPLMLKPGVYDVEILCPSVDAVELRDENNYGKVRVSIKPGRITEVWLNDSGRPKFRSPTSPALVRDVYGDIVGYPQQPSARFQMHRSERASVHSARARQKEEIMITDRDRAALTP